MSKTRSRAASVASLRFNDCRDLVAQRISKGATMRSPVVSPSHHVTQIAAYFDHSANPASARLVTPIVALITVLAAATNANLKTVWARSNAPDPWAKRLTKKAPQSASRVLPTAMHTEVGTLPAVVRLTR